MEVGDFLEQKFPEWGTRFISINDMYDSATLNGATGGIDIAFRNLIYELYSQDLSEKVRSAKLSLAKSGKFGNAEVFYGYVKSPENKGKLAVDEAAAEVVRRIFDLVELSCTPNQVAKMLNDEKVPTPQERKMQLGSKRRWTRGGSTFWYNCAIFNIIKDERYTGKLIYGKKRIAEVGQSRSVPVPREEWIVVPGAIPAIITEEQFQAVQAKIGKSSKPYVPQPASKLLFTRKIKCGHCGKGLRAVHRKDYVYYHCDTRRVTDKYGCKDFRICEKDVANAVLAALQQQIAFADNARELLYAKTESLAPSVEKLNGEIQKLQRLVEKTKSVKMGLWEKYNNGEITAEAFQRENEKVNAQANKYAEKISELQGKIRELEVETGRENVFVERFGKQKGITELTRPIVEEFIQEIRVFEADRIEVVFNYADEFEKIAGFLRGGKVKREVKGKVGK